MLSTNKFKMFLIINAAALMLMAAPAYGAGRIASIGLSSQTNVASATVSSGIVNVSLSYGSPPAFTLISSNGFNISPFTSPYVPSGSFNSYNEAQAFSMANGGVPAYTGSIWAVYTTNPAGTATEGSILISGDSGPLAVFNNTAPAFLQGENGLTNIGGKSYRGYIKPIRAANGVTLVNAVDLEHYLYSVVPSEMPALWHTEALKTQAVAARTYYIFSVGSHSSSGFDLCDNIHCQVYSGVGAEHPNSTEAVNKTAGIAIYYDNKPIEAVFSSSSGGQTQNSEDVWSATAPYLRSVKEVAEKEFKEWSYSFTFPQIKEGLAANGVNIGDIVSITALYKPYGRVYSITFNGTNGSKTYEKDAIRSFSNKLEGSLPSTMFTINGYGGGALTAAQPGTTDEILYTADFSGSYQKTLSTLFAVSANGTVAPVSSTGVVAVASDGAIKSYTAKPAATQQPQPNNAAETITITTSPVVLKGRGNGHGVGLSQYGAKGMAEEGYSFIDILKHYYTGVEVK